MSNIFRGGWITCTKQYFGELPIKKLESPADQAIHDRMVRLSTAMLEAQAHLAAATTERDTDYYRGKCDALDREIDALVYDLYGLTPEEIALVEAGCS